MNPDNDRKQLILSLARNLDFIKNQLKSLQEDDEYSIEHVSKLFDTITPSMQSYANPDYVQFQVDIHPILQFFSIMFSDARVDQVALSLMRLLPLTVHQLVRTSPGLAVPLLQQVDQRLVTLQLGFYAQAALQVVPNEAILKRFVHAAAQQFDAEAAQMYEQLCATAKVSPQEFLLGCCLSADERLVLAAAEMFSEQELFSQRYFVTKKLALNDPFYQFLLKTLRPKTEELELNRQLTDDFVDFRASPFDGQEPALVYVQHLCRLLDVFDAISEDQLQYYLGKLVSIIQLSEPGTVELNLSVRAAGACLNILRGPQKLTLAQHLSSNVVFILIKELKIADTYTTERLREAQLTVLERGDNNIEVFQPQNIINSKIASRLYSFSTKLISKLAFDQQKQVYELIREVSTLVHQGNMQFIYEELANLVDLKLDSTQLRVFELTRHHIKNLDLNSVNTLFSTQDFNKFTQQLDDVAVALILVNLFVLVNVLPTDQFLNRLFTNQLPTDLVISIIDNLLIAFNSMQYAPNSNDAVQQRQICQALLVKLHSHACRQGSDYHSLIEQPNEFSILCDRIIRLHTFIDKVAQANNIIITAGAMQSAFIQRIIQIIKDPTLSELHYSACQCLKTVQFDQSVLDVLEFIVKYSQNAIGEYLQTLIELFTKISSQFANEVIQTLSMLCTDKSSRITIVRFCFKFLSQVKLNQLQKIQQVEQVVTFIIQFSFASYFDDEEEVTSTSYNCLKMMEPSEVGNLLNVCIGYLRFLSTSNQLDVLNSIDTFILKNSQISISYVDIQLILAYFATFQSEDPNHVEENNIYSIISSFIFSVAIRLLASAQKSDDQYFSEYLETDLLSFLQQIAFSKEKFDQVTMTFQLTYINQMKHITPNKTQKFCRIYNLFVSMLLLIVAQFLGITRTQYQSYFKCNNEQLENLIQANLNRQFLTADIILALNRLIPHLKGIQQESTLIIDVFDISMQLLNECDLKYDVRSHITKLIEALSQSTPVCIQMLYGIKTDKLTNFWTRLHYLQNSLKFLKNQDQKRLESSIIKLIQVLSLTSLYQMQKKLQNFRFMYRTTQEIEEKLMTDIIYYDNLKEENLDEQQIIMKSRLRLQDRQVSIGINQLLYLFGHDKQQKIDAVDQAELSESEIDRNLEEKTLLEQAVDVLEQLDFLKQRENIHNMDLLVSTLIFSSLSYLINSDIGSFQQFLHQIAFLITPIELLHLPQFAEFVRVLMDVMFYIMPNVAFKAVDCLQYADITSFLCDVFDKIVFDSAESKAECQELILDFVKLFVPLGGARSPYLLNLSAIDYCIPFPMSIQQIEQLVRVFTHQIVVQFIKQAFTTSINSYVDRQELNRFVLNRGVFDRCKIADDVQLLNCYQLSASVIKWVPARFNGQFDKDFTQSVLRFLQMPLFSAELTPMQRALAAFVQKLDVKFTLSSPVALTWLTYNTGQDVVQFVTERVTELQMLNAVTEDYLVKFACTAQIVQNVSDTQTSQIFSDFVAEIVNQNRFEGGTALRERCYGVFVLFATFLRQKQPKVFANNAASIMYAVEKLREIVGADPKFSVSIWTALKALDAGQGVDNIMEWI